MKKQKSKYLIKKSLIGNCPDYHVYNMMPKDYIMGYFIGFTTTFIVLIVFFERLVFSFIISLIIGIFSLWPYNKYLISKRKTFLLMQFKDFLESLSASYSAGKNTFNAFKDAYNDMNQLYSSKADISNELSIIINGMENGFNIEELLNNFALRTEIEDIQSFANTFESGNRLGSNMKSIISNTREIISDKIDIEMEIKATVAEKKTELYIMILMPFIIILALKGLGDSTFSALVPINMITRIFVLIIIIIAYFIGKKITDIKV